MTNQGDQPRLSRTISLPLLVAYGVGTMVGGGFYALGRVAEHAGMRAPIAIAVSAVVALVTALSFSELSSRLPYSAGESRYVHEAFGRKWLSVLVGWAVIATGVVSAATLTRAFVGFWQDLIAVPTALGIIMFVAVLTGIAIRGILESVWLATVITIIEVGGLLWVLPHLGAHLGLHAVYVVFGHSVLRIADLTPVAGTEDLVRISHSRPEQGRNACRTANAAFPVGDRVAGKRPVAQRPKLRRSRRYVS